MAASSPAKTKQENPLSQRNHPMPDAKIVAELAPTGVLRAAINMGNFLLVTGKAPNGDPTGVSPDMALAIGARLGVPVISFTAAYAEIEATYLVPAGSPIKSVSEVDQPGKRLAVTARSAYGLW